jgi:Lactate racemase N-terminal domain
MAVTHNSVDDAPASGTSTIDSLLEGIPLPRMVKVRQTFDRPRVVDVEGDLVRKLRESGALAKVKPGHKIAVTAGSRGIVSLPLMLKILVSEIERAGGRPFLFPAMGSHGGATAEGQRDMLVGMGITEEVVGAPIRATMETVVVGTSDNGFPVHLDKYAFEADGIVVINRIKPHVAFRGPCESGLMKMIVLGMGKQKGADICHELGFGKMAENILAIGRAALAKANILCGVGILENAYHETARLEVLAGEEIPHREPVLLKEAWRLYPRIYFDRLDVLIIDEIGKDISGTGFDTNVVGRYHTPYASGGPTITRVAVLDITDRSHGNANGLGILDFTTRRAFDKFSFEDTYPNSLTSTVPMTVKIPMVLKNDRQAIQAAIKTCNIPDKSNVRLVRIKNTVALDEIAVSENLLAEVKSNRHLEALGEPQAFAFNDRGSLF